MAHNIHVPETVLARIWEAQSFFPDCLYTTTGLPVQVIRPGILNRDTGPDFTSALVRIGDQTTEGDVELHLHLSDWHAHGHDADPHYNRTILHVVLWPPERPTVNATAVQKANGELLPTVFVHHVLNESLPDLIERFEEKDQQNDQKRHRCQAQLGHMPVDQILKTLHRLGDERLYARARRVQKDFFLPEEVSSRNDDGSRYDCGQSDVVFEQALYETLCEGLGYTANKTPFREFAQRLPLRTIMTHLPPVQSDIPADHLLWIQAMLFGTSGLLPQQNDFPEHEPDQETAIYLDQLRSFWEMLKPTLDVTPMSPDAWQFFRLRPANFPTRRLAALSHLILSYIVQPAFSHYLELFRFCLNHPGQETKQIRLFERTLQVPLSDYWQSRYRFGPSAKTTQNRQFLGQSRIRDILISAVFPVYLGYALSLGYAELEAEIIRIYHRFPSPAWDHDTKTLADILLARHDIPGKQFRTAALYQGLLYLTKMFCTLPSCAECPLHVLQQNVSQ